MRNSDPGQLFLAVLLYSVGRLFTCRTGPRVLHRVGGPLSHTRIPLTLDSAPGQQGPYIPTPLNILAPFMFPSSAYGVFQAGICVVSC